MSIVFFFKSIFKVIFFWVGSWVVVHLILFLHAEDVAVLSYWNSYALANQNWSGCLYVSTISPPTLLAPNMLPSKFSVLVDPFCRSSHQPTSDENNLVHWKSSFLIKPWGVSIEQSFYKKGPTSRDSLSIVGASLVRNQHGKDELNVGFAPTRPMRPCRFVPFYNH